MFNGSYSIYNLFNHVFIIFLFISCIKTSLSMYLEQAQSYKYLGSTVNSDNSIEEEIQHRITLGNKAYYANQLKL